MSTASEVICTPALKEISAVVVPQQAHCLQLDETSWQLSFDIDESVPGVKEHFPQMPLIAGYMQLIWVQQLIMEACLEHSVNRIIDVKFSGQITPPVSVIVSLDLNLDAGRARFEIADTEGVKTKGFLALCLVNGAANVC